MRSTLKRNIFARRHENARAPRHVNSIHRERPFRRKKNSAARRSWNGKLAVKRYLTEVKKAHLTSTAGVGAGSE